jgi:hypothetical protein
VPMDIHRPRDGGTAVVSYPLVFTPGETHD